jgi:hypothetical protein
MVFTSRLDWAAAGVCFCTQDSMYLSQVSQTDISICWSCLSVVVRASYVRNQPFGVCVGESGNRIVNHM